jgi:peptide/nickel transport system substrate-binding protein
MRMRGLVIVLLVVALPSLLAQDRQEIGRPGGRLVVALRAEPRTLNPMQAIDAASADVIARMHGDLLHTDRQSQEVEPALATAWKVAGGGRDYTLTLRKGVRFSDGHPFDADDVLFTFRVLLDEKVGAPQRDLLIIGGKPVLVSRIDDQTVRVTLAQPYAAAERLFDSIAILPRHLLEEAYREGRLAQTWTLTTQPAAIAGLGPFRLKEFVAGQRLVLERNPYYWKTDGAGQRLPYLDELVFTFVGTEDAQVIRFQAGESDLLARANAENFALLQRDRVAKGYQLRDLGPGQEYHFLTFNLNDLSARTLPQVAAKQRWFNDVNFRRAVSRAIDREGIVRLAYGGRATPLWGHVSPGNRRWVNAAIPKPRRSTEESRALLRASGFSWRTDGALVDRDGRPVEFSIATSSTNRQRLEMATIIQADLKELGINVKVVPMEFRALLDRVFQTFDYDACLFAFGGGDADPNAEMNIWLSRGGSHIWRLGQPAPSTPWEAEIDGLMEKQLVTLDYAQRRRLFDRVQALVAEQLPFVFVAAPNILIGARGDLGNFRPAVLDTSGLWNADQLFLRPRAALQRTSR